MLRAHARMITATGYPLCAILVGCEVENGTSHINEYDWLLKYMTGGRLEVDLEKLNDWRQLHV